MPYQEDKEKSSSNSNNSITLLHQYNKTVTTPKDDATTSESIHPLTDANAEFALGVLDPSQDKCKSRNRDVFTALVNLHSQKYELLADLPRVIRYMCTLQPAEFIFVSFGLELEQYLLRRRKTRTTINKQQIFKTAQDLDFVSNFVSVMINVFLTSNETLDLRNILKDCISKKGRGLRDENRAQLFYILLNTFAHNIMAILSLCIWAGAYLTASTFLHKIDPLDINLMCYVELDQLIEFLERPLFQDLHLRMLECDTDPGQEGSGAMLYRVLKSILMLIPQSTSYSILKERLLTVARFRQCAVSLHGMLNIQIEGTNTEQFVRKISEVRMLHRDAKWRLIRSKSLEPIFGTCDDFYGHVDETESRRDWLGYKNEDDELLVKKKYLEEKNRSSKAPSKNESMIGNTSYDELHNHVEFSPIPAKLIKTSDQTSTSSDVDEKIIKEEFRPNHEKSSVDNEWKEFWERSVDT